MGTWNSTFSLFNSTLRLALISEPSITSRCHKCKLDALNLNSTGFKIISSPDISGEVNKKCLTVNFQIKN